MLDKMAQVEEGSKPQDQKVRGEGSKEDPKPEANHLKSDRQDKMAEGDGSELVENDQHNKMPEDQGTKANANDITKDEKDKVVNVADTGKQTKLDADEQLKNTENAQGEGPKPHAKNSNDQQGNVAEEHGEGSTTDAQDLYTMCADPGIAEQELLNEIEKSLSQVSKKDEKGRVALHYAVRFNGHCSQAIAKMLSVDPGIASETFPDSKLLPLHIICRHHASNLPSISAILDAYPKACETPDDYGCLPLHFACSGNAPLAVVRLLLAAHPPGSRHADASGWLPHHYTARCGTRLDVLRALIDANGEGATAVSKEGQVPLDCLALNPEASEDFLRALLDFSVSIPASGGGSGSGSGSGSG